jgi:hypothetical protein
MHGISQTQSRIYCQECNFQFPNRSLLDKHAKETQHAPYRCKCGKGFSRLDVIGRHIQSSLATNSYPCPYCKKHRGSRAFVRRDHLTQHLRGYHNMESENHSEEDQFQPSPRKRNKTFKCPHGTCSYAPGSSTKSGLAPPHRLIRTFPTQGGLMKHLREVHDESLFPCTETGCSRIGGKGFLRKTDLVEHAKDHHSTSDL